MSGCRTLHLPAGQTRLRTESDLFKVNILRMRSPAPNPVTVTPSPGRVVDAGKSQGGGGRDGVKIDLTAPATLVLGQSYSSGWRAYCDGRSLGAPRVVDGYANGWDVRPPCRDVSFAFAPDHSVRRIQLFSGIACLLMLLFVAWPRRRRRADRVPDPHRADAAFAAADARAVAGARGSADVHGRADARGSADAHGWAEAPGSADARGLDPSRGDRVPPASLGRALVLAAIAAAILGFCFSLRAGVLIFIGVALIVRLGIGPRVLAAAAGFLLAIVVPAVYLLFQATDRGGYNPGYAGEHIGAHWVAVAGYTLLLVALLQTLSRARSRLRGEAVAPAGAGASRSRS